MKSNKIKNFATSAILIGLATVLSFIPLPLQLPFGGKITLFSMLIISLPAYLYGVKLGFISSIAFAFLMMIIDPYFVHPVQILLDYIVAFGCFGTVAFFRKKKDGLIIGYILACICRFIAHCISGYIFFKEFAPENMNAVLYTIVYNGSFVFTECIFSLVLLFLEPIRKFIDKYKIDN